MKKITVTADTNDGDYIAETTEITDDQIQIIKPVIDAIKNFKPYQGIEWSPGKFRMCNNNFPIGEQCREDLGEKRIKDIYPTVDPEALYLFKTVFCPYDVYGIHTITDIVIDDEKYL